MQKKHYLLLDRTLELWRECFGDDVHCAATGHPLEAGSCSGEGNDQYNDHVPLVRDRLMSNLPRMELTTTTADASIEEECSYNEMYGEAYGCYGIWVGDLMRYGGCWSKEEDNWVWRLTGYGDHFEGMKPWKKPCRIFDGGGLHLDIYRTT